MLSWCLLHGLCKDPLGARLRPLAVGEDARREAGRSLMVSLRPDILSLFLGPPSNTEGELEWA